MQSSKIAAGIERNLHASANASDCESVSENVFSGRGGMLSLLFSSNIQSTTFK